MLIAQHAMDVSAGDILNQIKMSITEDITHGRSDPRRLNNSRFSKHAHAFILITAARPTFELQ